MQIPRDGRADASEACPPDARCDSADPQRVAHPVRHDLVVQPTQHQLEWPPRPDEHVAEHRRSHRGALGRDAGVVECAIHEPGLVHRPEHDRDARQRFEEGERVARRYGHRLEHQDGIDGTVVERLAGQVSADPRPSSADGTSTTAAIENRSARLVATDRARSRRDSRKPGGAVCAQRSTRGARRRSAVAGSCATATPAVSPGDRSRPP